MLPDIHARSRQNFKRGQVIGKFNLPDYSPEIYGIVVSVRQFNMQVLPLVSEGGRLSFPSSPIPIEDWLFSQSYVSHLVPNELGLQLEVLGY